VHCEYFSAKLNETQSRQQLAKICSVWRMQWDGTLASIYVLLATAAVCCHHFLPDWFYGLSDHLMILLCSVAGFVCMVCLKSD